jgi:hypothetical protein
LQLTCLKGGAKQLAAMVDGKILTVVSAIIDYKGKPNIVIANLVMWAFQ